MDEKCSVPNIPQPLVATISPLQNEGPQEDDERTLRPRLGPDSETDFSFTELPSKTRDRGATSDPNGSISNLAFINGIMIHMYSPILNCKVFSYILHV